MGCSVLDILPENNRNLGQTSAKGDNLWSAKEARKLTVHATLLLHFLQSTWVHMKEGEVIFSKHAHKSNQAMSLLFQRKSVFIMFIVYKTLAYPDQIPVYLVYSVCTLAVYTAVH